MSEPTGRSERILAAALRVHADLASTLPGTPPRDPSARPMRGWALLVAAVLLGALAGVVAGLVSLL